MTGDAKHTLNPAHMRLIDILARKDVEDYLRDQAAIRKALAAQRPNQVVLQRSTKAA